MNPAYRSIAAVTITTFVVCAAYCLVLAPMLEPGPKRRPRAASPETSLTSLQGGDPFAELFPEDSWQRRHPFTLRTERGSILFGDYRMGANGEVEVKPVSLIVEGGDSEGGKGRLYILDAPDGAILRFENGLDLSKNSSGLGKLLYARLLGPVEIESPPTSFGGDDGLYIATRGVQIDQTSIHTAQTIEMHFGPHRMMGRDLKLRFLNPEQKLKAATGMSSWAFADLEITQVDLVQFRVGGDGIALFGGGSEEPQARRADASAEALTPIEIRCQGRFKFDFLTLEASFRDQVEVLRLPPRGEADSLRCEVLSLSLASEEGVAVSGRRPERFTPSRLTATGRPAVLTSPSADVSARCEQMDYWIDSRKIVLQDPQRVSLKRGASEFRSPSIEYVLAREPRRLGRLHAKGRGELIAVDPRFPSRSMRAEWDQELKLEPEGAQHRLEMRTGAVLYLAGDQHRFRAREMKLWLEEHGAPTAVARRRPTTNRNRRTAWSDEKEDDDSLVQPAGGAASPLMYEIRPRRMLAIGSVEADTPELRGATQRMELIFNYPEPSKAKGSNPTAPAPASSGGESQRRSSSNSNRPDAPPDAKYDLVGDFIKVEIESEGDAEPAISEVTVHKNLRFERFDLTDPSAPPLRVSGDQFKLTGGIRGDAEVVISGSPAEVSAEDISITGPEIHLQQRRNRVYIDQPGKVVIRDLANALAAGESEEPASPLGESLTAKLIEVAWSGRMEFDGKKVAFERDVVANLLLADRDGIENELEILSGSLELYLNRPVSFGARAQLPEERYGDKLSLDRLIFDGGVDITNDAFDARDRRTAFDQLHARNLSYDHVSGGFKADGPGYVSSVRRGAGVGASLTSPLGRPTNSRPTSNSESANKNGLTYLRVDFDGAITGNLFNRDLTFDRRVQAVYSPVEAWEDVIDPNVKGALGEEGLALQAEEMSIFQVGDPNAKGEAAFEFEARGNVMIEGSRFLAYGARTSYAPAKRLVLLQGSPRKDCEIQKLNERGVVEFKQTAGQMLYRTDTREVQIKNAGQSQVFETPQMRLPQTGGTPSTGAGGAAPRPSGVPPRPGAGPPKPPSVYLPGQR